MYASSTGNTQYLAENIFTFIQKAGFEVDLQEIYDVNPNDLLEYDGILVGTYTWDGGEVPDECMDVYEELEDLDLSGKKAFVFGSGDSFYTDTYGAGLQLFEEKLSEQNAEIITPYYLVDLEPTDEDFANCLEIISTFLYSF